MLIKILSFFMSLALMAGLGGCAARPNLVMLDPLAENVSLEKHGAVVLSIDLDNLVKPDWVVWKLGGVFSGTVLDDQNQLRLVVFGAGYYPKSGAGFGPSLKDGRKDVPALLLLPPGTYRLSALIGSTRYLLLASSIHFPIDSDTFTVKPGQGIYLGHVSVKLDEKKSPMQISADALVGMYPRFGHTTVMAQAPSKLQKSTPSILNSNRFHASIKELKQDFPYLQDVDFIDASPINARLPLEAIVKPEAK